jgi:traf2 and nck interacting kinase, tnik, putative
LLLCYDNEGVYVNTHGKVSKNIILQWGEMPTSVAYIGTGQIMGWGNKAIEIRNVENGQLDGVFMHKRAQKLKFLCERNDKVDLKNRLTYLQFNHLFINTLYYVSGIFLIQRRLFMSNLLYDT